MLNHVYLVFILIVLKILGVQIHLPVLPKFHLIPSAYHLEENGGNPSYIDISDVFLKMLNFRWLYKYFQIVSF